MGRTPTEMNRELGAARLLVRWTSRDSAKGISESSQSHAGCLDNVAVQNVRGGATELRMLNVTKGWNPSCEPINIAKSVASIAAELPW